MTQTSVSLQSPRWRRPRLAMLLLLGWASGPAHALEPVRDENCGNNQPPEPICADYTEVLLDDQCNWQATHEDLQGNFYDPEGDPLHCTADRSSEHGFRIWGSWVTCGDGCTPPGHRQCLTAIVPRDEMAPQMTVDHGLGNIFEIRERWLSSWHGLDRICQVHWVDNCNRDYAIQHGIIRVTSSDPDEEIHGEMGDFYSSGLATDWYGFMVDLDRSRGARERSYLFTYAALDKSGNLATAECRIDVVDPAHYVARDDDSPFVPLPLQWLGLSAVGPREVDGLEVEIDNVTPKASTFDAILLTQGLMRHRQSMELGTHTLASGDHLKLFIPAHQVPIQNLTGASQARMELTIHRAPGSQQPPRRLLSTPLFYRHGEAYDDMMIFSNRTLIDQLGGHLVERVPTDTPEEMPIGRVHDGQGGFRTITLGDASYATRVDGRVIGREMGMRITRGTDENSEENQP